MIDPPVFCTAHPFTQPQNPMLYNAFNQLDTPKIAPSHGGIYTPCNTVPWTHPTQLPKLQLNRFSHFCTAHGGESLCVIKKLITAINTIKNCLTAL